MNRRESIKLATSAAIAGTIPAALPSTVLELEAKKLRGVVFVTKEWDDDVFPVYEKAVAELLREAFGNTAE